VIGMAVEEDFSMRFFFIRNVLNGKRWTLFDILLKNWTDFDECPENRIFVQQKGTCSPSQIERVSLWQIY
jgi:hypothetical protein